MGPFDDSNSPTPSSLAFPTSKDVEEQENLRTWNPEEAVKSLALEAQSIGDGETEKETAQRIITESLPVAALSMIHLCQNARNENTRLKASQWLLEKGIGKANMAPEDTEDDETNLERMVRGLMEIGADDKAELTH